MADNEKSGMGMLCKLVGDLGAVTCGKRVDDAIVKSCVSGEYPRVGFGAFLGEVADQIEREHAEELAAAKRDMTEEAREVVERLRALKHSGYDWRWTAVNRAIGIEGNGGTPENRWGNTIDRLCDLIEHGGKQDVDVAALRELADDLESVEVDGIGTDYARGYEFACGYAAALVRKAIEGAPVDLATAAGNLVARCRPCRERREAAADWVEAQGGLGAVKQRMLPERLCGFDFTSRCLDLADACVVEYDEAHWVETMADVKAVVEEHRRTLVKIGRMLGVGEGDMPPLPEVLFGELDKRLMPPDMEWPRDAEGRRFEFGDAFLDAGDGEHVFHSVELRDNAAAGLSARVVMRGSTTSEYDGVAYSVRRGERVKRPAPAVLGADGKPIVEGETVYYSTWATCPGEKAGVVAVAHDDVSPRAARKPWVRYVDGGWDYANILTHTPPDTQERIDEGKRKETSDYWCCGKYADCDACAQFPGGENPYNHYGVRDCAVAQGMDIARREQGLDARTSGGAE